MAGQIRGVDAILACGGGKVNCLCVPLAQAADFRNANPRPSFRRQKLEAEK
jgi:hypothetical protein